MTTRGVSRRGIGLFLVAVVLIAWTGVSQTVTADGGKKNKLTDEQIQQVCQQIVTLAGKGDYANATKAVKDANPDKDSLVKLLRCIFDAMQTSNQDRVHIILELYKLGIGFGEGSEFWSQLAEMLADALEIAFGELLSILVKPKHTKGFLDTCIKTMKKLGFSDTETLDVCEGMIKVG